MANARYYLTDDITNTGGAGASGKRLVDDFEAPSVAAATQTAHIIASALQRPVLLVACNPGGAAPTKVTGVLPTVAITAQLSGIGY